MRRPYKTGCLKTLEREFLPFRPFGGVHPFDYRLGGRIEMSEWIDLSVESERTTQASGAAHQVALYGHLGW